ncbi:hypothetical protein [Mesorhizobium sp. RMAD-H1]|uniref:hypothetical protein n=1 Tax=Mesorhizobium sp. RMAD-H1 TaxID=2587065 RepID=UPI00160B269C|nr:hypothetical protein [Mesorhizobium sp. RMAD-H1]MBB2973304.1 hypothetical protein [Mesorhizobium sp. RMAD-H1]
MIDVVKAMPAEPRAVFIHWTSSFDVSRQVKHGQKGFFPMISILGRSPRGLLIASAP